MEVTWEPASTIPLAAVDEYEKGIMSEASEQLVKTYGHKACTLHVKSSSDALPSAKRPRTETPDNSATNTAK